MRGCGPAAALAMKGSERLITVGVPVYNAMPWLAEAMESLLGQTAREFEILCIVDGSTDASTEYLRSVHDERLRVIEQKHAGVTATLNRLLRETRTPWMVRQDADDVSYPARIQRLLEEIRSHPDAGLIYSMADYYPREHCAGRFRSSRGSPSDLQAIVRSGYLLSVCHSTVALHVGKARAAGGYRTNVHAEDADLWWRMALRHDVRFIPEALAGFRQNEGSVSSVHFEAQQIGGLYVQYLLLSELWGKHPRPLEAVRPILSRFLRPGYMRAKKSLRACNMHLAAGCRVRGAAALARAVVESPGYVLQRVLDEFREGVIANGVSPHLFLERKESLWP